MFDVNTMSPEQLREYVAKLKQENDILTGKTAELEQAVARVRNIKPRPVLRINKHGALAVRVGAKLPVTLYKNQWIALLDKGQEIFEFIEANRDKIVDADEKAQEEAEKVAA